MLHQWLNKPKPQKLMMLRLLKMRRIRLIKSKITLQERREALLIKSFLLQALPQLSLVFSSQRKLPPLLL
jgi:O-succinylbenzoate synthase